MLDMIEINSRLWFQEAPTETYFKHVWHIRVLTLGCLSFWQTQDKATVSVDARQIVAYHCREA